MRSCRQEPCSCVARALAGAGFMVVEALAQPRPRVRIDKSSPRREALSRPAQNLSPKIAENLSDLPRPGYGGPRAAPAGPPLVDRGGWGPRFGAPASGVGALKPRFDNV